MKTVDEIVNEINKQITELKVFTQQAYQYSCYVETDLSNFEVVKSKYVSKKNGKSSKSGKNTSPRFLKRRGSRMRDVA
jgi:hypothetical protein|uniref:Uncharacterized protein n=1 Tax=viral metagenome TaxID=1070528 RepID=A0A6C0D5A6_9ZZZZ